MLFVRKDIGVVLGFGNSIVNYLGFITGVYFRGGNIQTSPKKALIFSNSFVGFPWYLHCLTECNINGFW
jgi:hypothetical protein